MDPLWRRFKLSVLLVCVTVLVLVLGYFAIYKPHHKVTAQMLLREALAEHNRSANSKEPNFEIFMQQATQGYYDDALANARLARTENDQKSLLVALARVEAENGDITSAVNISQLFPAQDFRTEVVHNVALVQAQNGDLNGALQAVSGIANPDDVLAEFAAYQIRHDDFDGALATAERLSPTAAGQIFYEVGDALRLRHEQARLSELAKRMRDRKMAALFLELAPWTMREPTPEVLNAGICDSASFYASEGHYAEAHKAVEHTRCWRSFIATQEYVTAPKDAETFLRTTKDQKDLAFGLVELAILASKQGKIEEALRLDSEAVPISRSDHLRAELEIARAWAIRDGPEKATSWARSLPDPHQRCWALLGVAQALGHERPHHL